VVWRAKGSRQKEKSAAGKQPIFLLKVNKRKIIDIPTLKSRPTFLSPRVWAGNEQIYEPDINNI